MGKVANNSFTGVEDSIILAFEQMDCGKAHFYIQNGVEPHNPYCIIHLITENPVGQPEESVFVNGTTRETVMRQTWTADARFVFIGKDAQYGNSSETAQNNAAKFNMKIRQHSIRQIFADNGLSVLRISTMRRSKAPRENDTYAAYAMDVTLAYEKQEVVNLETIDHGQIIGTFTEAKNDPLTTTLAF